MRLLCFVVSFVLVSSIAFASSERPLCVGIYYAENPPLEMFFAFDWLVLDPDASKETLTSKKLMIEGKRAKIFGYLSVGEIETFRNRDIDKLWILGENKYWQSYIADVRNPEYQNFLLKKADEIVNLDFDGFFLDTLDSYKMVIKKEDFSAFQKAIEEFIFKLKEKYPNKKIILNRGFDIYDDVKNLIDGFLVEGVYYKLDLKTGNHVQTKEEEKQELLNLLKPIKEAHPVIILDYLDIPNQNKEGKELINQIISDGFIPYISTKELNIIGLSPCSPKPRKALIIFNSKDAPHAEDPHFTHANRLVQPYLEYYGISVDSWDLNKGLPPFPLWDRYNLVVYWAYTPYFNIKEIEKWILQNIEYGVKFFFVGNLPSYDSSFLKKLGLLLKNESSGGWTLKYKSQILGLEIEPKPKFDPIIDISEGEPLLAYEKGNSRYVPIAYTSWGGYALDGVYIRSIGEDMFVINPFLFFKRLLKDINTFATAEPVTTENGRRILTVHIDADGFNQKTEIKGYTYASEVILNEIFKKYRIPHALSLIEGEIAPYGAYPDDRHDLLQKIAKEIFELPNVIPASHTFSHPFDYYKINEASERHNLKIPDYKYSFEREILGSVDYINQLSYPKKTQLIFWTGKCNPLSNNLKFVYENSLYNINGGRTRINKRLSFLSFINPTGVDKGGYYQIYAPVTNENVFTEGWSFPYRYTEVIQTFELTDKPYRIKPIGIYYHLFSGSKISYLKALKKVYDWALSQEYFPIYILDYIKKVLDFRNTVFIPMEDGGLRVRNGGFLRTLRIDGPLKIDLERSKGIIGYKKINNSIYLHLDGSGDYILFPGESDVPYLVDSNGMVESYKRFGKKLELTLSSYTNLSVSLYFPKECKLKTQGKVISQGKNFRINFAGNRGAISVSCP